MKNPNPPPSRPSAAGKAPAGMAPARKSRWGPPPPGAAPAGDKAAPSTSARTPTPTRTADSRRHPGPPTAPAPHARNPASPAAALRPQSQLQPAAETPPPQPYGFHNLDRRTMLLADGTVRTYFALPPDYPFEPAPLPPLPHHLLPRASPDLWPPHQAPPPQMPMPVQMPPHEARRKHPADQDEGFPRHPKQPRLDGPHQPPPHAAVDRHALRRAFLKYAKMLNESSVQRRSYLEGGRVPCLACGRSSKDFADVHGLVMHASNPPNADSLVDHLGLHKALCVLMGWDYTKVPENSKGYQSLPSDLVQASRDDLIVWPPTVIIHNTSTGRKKDGRFEGLGNKEMDKKMTELGFSGGKSKSLYGKEGHMGLTLIKFANNPSGLKEAERLAEFLERQDRGRIGWSRAHASRSVDSDQNPLLVETDIRTAEKKRILYGYLAIASDLDELDSDSRKRAFLKSRREFDPNE
ncbi:protein SUPPRESSOR OF GENE SILENCING 3 homolog [Miscanthus floridulus]|uniref:protein SUPPRESSOR OF GENE SILENCING 3 homolog n=1 Tax=Miscanthus floridulus TaxID=154761 RepID=UPI003458F244